MNLEELRANWNELGSTDPFWAILSVPEYKGNRWNVEEFFRTGEAHVADLLGRLGDPLGLPTERNRALDFGCGVGRLTQALADHFDHVDGVDIAPSMIESARRYNSAAQRCSYHLNERADLELFGDSTFDFVVSEIVLQHMRPEYALRYVCEFVRVLRPRGLLIFQIPYESVNPTSRPGPWDPRTGPRIEMFSISFEDVVASVEEAGGKLLRFEETALAAPAWHSYRYAVTRASAAD